MATVVIMPRQGQSVESCIITTWEKKVGDAVQEGDLLFTYETDKACFEETAKVSGTLLATFFEEQDDVPCLTEVAVIGEPGEDISAYGKTVAGEPTPTVVKTDASTPVPIATVAAETTAGISPRARAAAEKLHINLDTVTPTGPHGRVIERDVIAAQQSSEGSGIGGRVLRSDTSVNTPVAKPSTATVECAGYRDEKLSHMRKVIAKSMHASLSDMAQLTHNTSFDATSIMAYRKQLKVAESLNLPNITINDIVMFAVSRVLKDHPALNANLIGGDTMRYFDHVHLGMAVDTPRGLLVPTIFNADTLSLAELAAKAKELAAEAQSGSISPDLLSGGSFTVSNLGSLGIEHFTPVINPPQTGILGVDCVVDRVRQSNGQITVYPAMGLSLTYDHRALDGAPASRFLKDLKLALENFPALLAK